MSFQNVLFNYPGTEISLSILRFDSPQIEESDQSYQK